MKGERGKEEGRGEERKEGTRNVQEGGVTYRSCRDLQT